LTERATDIKDTDSTGPHTHGTTANESGARNGNCLHAPFSMWKRINSTIYEVEVYFSSESGETLDDKILRLVRGEALNREDEQKWKKQKISSRALSNCLRCAIIESLQAGPVA
jgi:hypothetical protein